MIIMNLIPIRKTTLHEDNDCALQRTSQRGRVPLRGVKPEARMP